MKRYPPLRSFYAVFFSPLFLPTAGISQEATQPMDRRWRHLLCAALVVGSTALSGTALAGAAVAGQVVINSVDVDRVSQVLSIEGDQITQGFLGSDVPYVEFNGQVLKLVPGWNNSFVQATLPASVPDGDYQVFVSRSSLPASSVDPHNLPSYEWATFSVTLITPIPGPQGPAGLTGAQGPQGAQGPSGATGATGATGAQGSIGPAGPIGAASTVPGPRGSQGPAGPAGATGATGPAGPAGTAAIPSNLTTLSQQLGTSGYSSSFTYTYQVSCELGDIIFSANNYTAGNALPADGRLLPISGYTALFSILGTTFGGDGVSTFGLPNLRAFAPTGLVYSVCVSGIFPSRS